MEGEDISPEQEMKSSSSTSTEWIVIDKEFVNKLNLSPESEDCGIESSRRPSGLFDHENLAANSGVEELATENDQLHHHHHTDSNSSSDIDVIDEVPDYSHRSMSIQTLDTSFHPSETPSMSTSDRVALLDHPDRITTWNGEPLSESFRQADDEHSLSQRLEHAVGSALEYIMAFVRLAIDAYHAFHGDQLAPRDYLAIGFLLSVVIVLPCTQVAFNKASMQEAKIEQMESHVNKLKSENEHLKNKVLEKIESGKLLGDLDDEMRALKSENYKLHKSMQVVMEQLEDQMEFIRKGMEMKENAQKEPYKNEIAKLKEQINLLRFDNEELQKQLVRIRYGKHAANKDEKEDTKKDKPGEKLSKEGSYEDIKERREEIKELRRKLNEEVDKLKLYKESLEQFVKDLEDEKEKDGIEYPKEGQETIDEDEHIKHGKGNWKNKKPKNKNFNDWSWIGIKDLKKTVKGTFENFPGMFSKYVPINKEKVDGVLDTINHYYKKAHEKTKKFLKSYSVDEKTESVKNDIWNLMSELKNKWMDGYNIVKNKFEETQNNFGRTQTNKPNHKEKQHGYEKVKKSEWRDETETARGENKIKKDFLSKEEKEAKWMEHLKEANRILEGYRKTQRSAQQNVESNARVYEKVQSELGNNQDEIDETDLNWFLRKNNEEEKLDNEDLNWFLKRSNKEGVSDRKEDLNWFLRKADDKSWTTTTLEFEETPIPDYNKEE